MADKIIILKKFLVLSFSFALCALSFTLIANAYAFNLDKMKARFLSSDYKQAIIEGEKAIAGIEHSTDGLDELYYLLGLSYLKDGNYLRASDISEIILREFKGSRFKEDALLALGDTYFLRGDYQNANAQYRKVIDGNPSSKLRFTAYYRISQCALKTGDTQQAKEYLSRLKEEAPESFEFISNKDLDTSCDIYYTVQVGSFSSSTNAQNFMQKLIQNGYPAYLEEAKTQDNVTYRVRIGKFKLRQETQELENKLTQEGYPTKIYP